MVGLSAATFATLLAVAVALAGTAPSSGQVSGPFGGPMPVHLAHVGHIEVDLEPGRVAGLRRVPCAGVASPLASCFVAR